MLIPLILPLPAGIWVRQTPSDLHNAQTIRPPAICGTFTCSVTWRTFLYVSMCVCVYELLTIYIDSYSHNRVGLKCCIKGGVPCMAYSCMHSAAYRYVQPSAQDTLIYCKRICWGVVNEIGFTGDQLAHRRFHGIIDVCGRVCEYVCSSASSLFWVMWLIKGFCLPLLNNIGRCNRIYSYCGNKQIFRDCIIQ